MWSCFTAPEWKEMIHQRFRRFFYFSRDFSLQSFWSVKLIIIPGRTANITLCSPQTCCLSAVNKKDIFKGLMTKHFRSFEFKVQKRANFGQIFAYFLLASAEKLICFTFFFMELLTNYVGVIVPGFKLFNLAELALRLFIENAWKSNWIPGLQNVRSVKLMSLRKFRIANITFLKPHLHRLKRVPLTVKIDAT